MRMRAVVTIICFFAFWQDVIATPSPTPLPTMKPTPSPTRLPTLLPTYSLLPTISPPPTNTFNPTPIPTSTPAPSGAPTHVPTNTYSPTPKPTFFPTAGPLAQKSAFQAFVEAMAIAFCLGFVGIVMGMINKYQDDTRAKKKHKKVMDYADVRHKMRETIKKEGGKTDLEIEAEVLKMLPDRDFDEEELQEIADEPNPLENMLSLVWTLFYPVRMFCWQLCCAVERQKVQSAVIKDDFDEDDFDEDMMIDGFPIDCGTKHRKFLSMAKCKSVASSRHPHKVIEAEDGSGEYVEPYRLNEDMGQHNLSPYCLPEFKKQYGCLRPHGFIEDYGIGMALYFKFLKTMYNMFFWAALIAIIPITYNWAGSSWKPSDQAVFLSQNTLLYSAFFSSSGSLGGSSYVCSTNEENSRLQLDCPNGNIQRIEAYYGTPFGSCTCPATQQVVASTGSCPATPDTSRYEHGECTTAADDDLGEILPCFKGYMWNGDLCCSHDVDPKNKWPDFEDLALQPHLGCNSASAQFILQAECLGYQNCTVDVVQDKIFEWEISETAPCIEGVVHQNNTCRASFNSPNSNLTNCPSDSSEKRLIARAVCDSTEFQFNDSGKHYSRKEWAKLSSWIDAGINLMVFLTVIWMAEKEKSAVDEEDITSCSTDDFTLRIVHLPPPKKGMSPDLDKLKHAIKKHFENLLKEIKPVIQERHCEVIDVNLGMNNQDTIKKMKVRGRLARVLDLASEKLALMQEYNTGSEKEIKKQDRVVRILKVKFLKVCEEVKFNKRKLEAKTAFVTFDSEEAYERINRVYIKKKYWCGQPKNLLFSTTHSKETFKMEITKCYAPSDYLWENLSTNAYLRYLKVLTANVAALAFLIIGFAIIIQAKAVESSAKLRLGSTDCTLYTFEYSGDPLWTGRILNETGSSGGSAVYTRVDVQHNEFPDKYNITYPDTGMRGCYCGFMFTNHFSDIETVEFLNPNTELTETWCADWLSNYYAINVMTNMAVLAVVVVNEGLKACFRSLVSFEGHETRTQEILSLAIKLFFAMLINTALLVLLISGNLNVFTEGKQGPITRDLESASLFAGDLSDFTPEWYFDVGASITVTMFVNVFALNSASFIEAVQMKLGRCLDRGCTFDMSRTNQKLQVQLETLYTGPKLKLEERYAAMLVAFTVCTVYSGGMPMLWFVGFLSFYVAYMVDKWAFLRVYQLPPKYGPALARTCTDFLPWSLLIHAMLSAWTYTTPELYDYEDITVVGNTNMTSVTNVGDFEPTPYDANTDFWSSDTYQSFSLGRVESRLTHTNAIPHLTFITFWAVWYILTRVLEFDLLIEYIIKYFEEEEAEFADAADDMDAIMKQEEAEKERWEKLGIDPATIDKGGSDKDGDKSSDKGSKLPDKALDKGSIEMQPIVSLDGDDDGDDDGNDKQKKKDDAKSDKGKDDTKSADTAGGAPAGSLDDRDESISRKPSSSNPLTATFINGGAPSGVAITDAGASMDTGTKVDVGAIFAPTNSTTSPPTNPASATTNGPNSSRANRLSRQSSFLMGGTKKAPLRSQVGSEPDHALVMAGLETHYVKHDESEQVSLDMSEAYQLEIDQRKGGIENDDHDGDAAVGGGGGGKGKKKNKKNKKTGKKGGRTSIFSKKKSKNDTVQDELAPTRLRSATEIPMEDMTEEEIDALGKFREKWLNVTLFVQGHRGHRHIEGNPDFMWALSSEALKKHIYLKVLSKKVLENFETELHLRSKFPDIQHRVNRHIRGLPSYDFFANEEYIEAFAMETKSIRNYQRGKLQVSGEDFALAHAGVWNWIKKHFFGFNAGDLDVVFPEIRDELSVDAERHTTAIGIDPTKVAGPRFILNIRVPPPPPNLITSENPHVIKDMDDNNYDEWEENWQYLRITVKDVFSYRIRLPKGLQSRKIPEIQVEIPCVEQTLSTHKTILIGGVRVATGGAAAELSQQAAINITNGIDVDKHISDILSGHHEPSGPGKHEMTETTLKNINSAQDAENVDRERNLRKDAEKQNEDLAAIKIQSAWKGKQARKSVTTMKRWELKYLVALEGGYATALAIVLVIADLTLSIGYSTTYPQYQEPFGYFVSIFFLLELSLRFYCYSVLNKSKGCDFSDCNFFTQDWTRSVDLFTVVLDIVSILVLLAANNASTAGYLRSGKGARAVRAFKLIRFFRAARIGKLARLIEHEGLYQLTGLEPMSSQRFHIVAPREIEKGNRIDVMIPHLGKVNIQFPLYAREDQPIQFHLPVICKHHLGELAPNCLLARPESIDDAATNTDYSDKMQQYGWLQMWSTLDDNGLGMPPIKKKKLKNMMKKTGKSEAECKKIMQTEEYQDFYADSTKHRVWYQMMAFAPKPVIKRWTDLDLFSHEVDAFNKDIVMTLRPGELRGERIECKINTARGMLHHQKHVIHVPGVGDVNTILLCTNEVVVPGLFEHPVRALGVLPWGAHPVQERHLIPDVIAEVTFDFPAITLPRATEIISMRYNKGAADLRGSMAADATAVSLGSNKKAVSHGKYLERETFTRSFQVMPLEIVHAMKVAKKKAKREAYRAERKRRREKARSCFGGKSQVLAKLDELVEEIEEDMEDAFEDAGETAQSITEKVNSITEVLSANGSDDEDGKKGGGGGGAPASTVNDDEEEEEHEKAPLNNEKESSSSKSDASPKGLTKKKPDAKKRSSSKSPEQRSTTDGTNTTTADTSSTSSPPAGVGHLKHEESIADNIEQRIHEDAKKKNENIHLKAQEHVEQAQRTRAKTLAEAKEEAKNNMEGVDLEMLKTEAMDVQRILLPRVGKFDVAWPPTSVEPFNVSFPAIKPAKQLREEVQTLIEIPSENNANITPMARRYQFGWVLVETLEPSPSGHKVYLRLPAYVSHRQRALGTLDPDDFASPYSNRTHSEGHEGHGDDSELLKAKADAAQLKIQKLEAEIAKLQAAAASNANTATPSE